MFSWQSSLVEPNPFSSYDLNLGVRIFCIKSLSVCRQRIKQLQSCYMYILYPSHNSQAYCQVRLDTNPQICRQFALSANVSVQHRQPGVKICYKMHIKWVQVGTHHLARSLEIVLNYLGDVRMWKKGHNQFQELQPMFQINTCLVNQANKSTAVHCLRIQLNKHDGE